MRSYLQCLAGCAMALLATGAMAQGETYPQIIVAQSPGEPVDRAAGNGSMGTGEGIEYLPEKSDERSLQPRRTFEPDEDSEEAELRHGGNETDMSHRRRPTLGDGQD